MQEGRVVQAADDSARDWLLLSRIDPSNAITLNNLGVARFNAAEALWYLGRPREAVAKGLENSEPIEAAAARSSMAQWQISGQQFWAAVRLAELGEIGRADALYAQSLRHLRAWTKSQPGGSFEAELWDRLANQHQARMAYSKGDTQRARELSQGVPEALRSLKPGDDPGRRRTVAEWLGWVHRLRAQIEAQAGDFEAAARAAALAVEARRPLADGNLVRRAEEAADHAWWALALARSGKVDEARPQAKQALDFFRELQQRKTDHEMVKLDIAAALIASAYADRAQAKALLAEAQALFDSMPAEARTLRSSRFVQSLIGQARANVR